MLTIKIVVLQLGERNHFIPVGRLVSAMGKRTLARNISETDSLWKVVKLESAEVQCVTRLHLQPCIFNLQKLSAALDHLYFHVVLHHMSKNELTVEGAEVVSDNSVSLVFLLEKPEAKLLHDILGCHWLSVFRKTELGTVSILSNDSVGSQALLRMFPGFKVEKDGLWMLNNCLWKKVNMKSV